MRSFLRGQHDDTTLAELVETRDHDFGGVGHASFGQRVAGLDVYGTYVKASFAASGDLVSVVELVRLDAAAVDVGAVERPEVVDVEPVLAAHQ